MITTVEKAATARAFFAFAAFLCAMHNLVNHSTRMTDQGARQFSSGVFVMRKSVVSAFAALIVAAGLTAAQPASAEQVTARVNYADLDLTTPAGVAALQARVARAVKAACTRADTMRDLGAMSDWQRCVDAMTEQARLKIREKVQLASR
jgi:UrcA family protein